MSFSKDVKEELSSKISSARHCQIAEIAAIISLCGHISISLKDKYSIRISTENLSVARKCFTLLKKTFNIYTEISIRQNAYLLRGRTYTIVVRKHEDALTILQAIKLLDEDGEIGEDLSPNNVVIMKDCCKMAFLRGAFMASGSISNPNNSYHLEIVCTAIKKALQLKDIMIHLGLYGKVVKRNRHFVVYIKEGEDISLFLNMIEAHISLMEFENIRILKDMRNTVNRKVNCETANLNKVVKTSYKQIEDINFIDSCKGLNSLPNNLYQVAKARLENKEASLAELGQILEPPVGKSGVNHRLRKLAEIAQELRGHSQVNE